MSVLFFGTLIWGVWWLAWQTARAHFELQQQEKEEEEEDEQEQEKEKKLEKKKTYQPNRPKREVVFRDADKEEEILEDVKPAGKHIYDPKQHKVVWVPAE
jgi:flagellar biosynthesis component FlhA